MGPDHRLGDVDDLVAESLDARLADVDRAAVESGFAGAVRVDLDGGSDGGGSDVGGRTAFARAYGLAHRALGVPNTVGTRFAIASGTKAFTALTVMSLVEGGTLTLDTPVRRWLRDDLPLVADDVTVEQLLAHRSGIGDYLDEGAGGEITDYVLTVPLHRLATAEDYLAVLAGYPTAFRAGQRFAYNNGGYVVLALVAERAAGVPYHDLVDERVVRRAGLQQTAFLRSDALPGSSATGYLFAGDDLRTNVLHLPVRGVGDGGVHMTIADVHTFWAALTGGRIVSPATVTVMTRPRSDDTDSAFGYGLGFWLERAGGGVLLEGYDAGVSFRSLHRPSSGLTWTVVSNWSDGAWPVAKALAAAFPP